MSLTAGPINPIFIADENYSICSRCRHEIMTLADGSAYCSCNESELAARFDVQPPCGNCGGTGTVPYHWSISALSHGVSRIPCPTCQPKPYDDWKFAS